ncbi:TPA: hypothetical protein ACGWTY_002858 [Pseudomonas aeruginosa]
MNKALDLLREIRPSIPKEVLELWCKDRDAFLASHPAVEQAGVAAKLTFINGRPAMCGCQVEYSDGGGEYSDVIYVTLCAKHSGSAILDLVATNRIALTPEYEGQWHADLYLDREIPLAKVEGATPAEAVLALMSAERIDPEQESVEQAGGDERAAFELFVRKHCGMPEHIAVNWDAKFTNDAWEGWQARAALAQPSPKCATCNGSKVVSTTDTDHNGDHIEAPCPKCGGTGEADSGGVHPWGEPILIPCDCETEKAEAERPEVVAYLFVKPDGTLSMDAVRHKPSQPAVAVMTVAQHERIVGAHAGAIRLLADSVARLRAECNAALARVAEMEKELAMARDAAAKGDAARHAAGGMEMEIEELRAELAELRARVVVVPDAANDRRKSAHYCRGWNACLDELARINGMTVSESALDTLRKAASGEVKHLNNGLCPDDIEGHEARDPDCPVCRALIETGKESDNV